jgi:(E)-4-hydroxy-3-methylbut-2-enyl-diphosphate synthase
MPREKALAEALVEAAFEQVKILESFSFTNIKVSLKASSVPVTVAAYRRFSELSDYPLHLGVTEAGTVFRGTVKSAVGIGALLLDARRYAQGELIALRRELKVAKAIHEGRGSRISRR